MRRTGRAGPSGSGRAPGRTARRCPAARRSPAARRCARTGWSGGGRTTVLECVVMARPAAGRWTFTMTERGQSAGTCGTEYSRSQQTVARMPGLYVATVAVHAVIYRSSVAVPGRRRSGSSSARAESSWMMACIPGSAASVDHVHRCSRRSGRQHDQPSSDSAREGSATGSDAPSDTRVPWVAMVVAPRSPRISRR